MFAGALLAQAQQAMSAESEAGTRAPTESSISLVCQTAPERRIIAFGSTFHVELNKSDMIASDDVGGGQSRLNESGDYFIWKHAYRWGSATLELDRRTLQLLINTGPAQAYYQCQITPARQF